MNSRTQLIKTRLIKTTPLKARTSATAVLLAAGLLLAGCGEGADQPNSTSSGSRSSSGSSGPSVAAPSSATIAVTVAGDRVTPNGKRVKVGVGEPVTLTVESDRAGELHVHSTPEQELKYAKGKTTLKVTIDKPGIVDIEDHIADVVVVQLEVS
jgi:hypothetical protein